jgi:uncharacterized protein YjdB
MVTGAGALFTMSGNVTSEVLAATVDQTGRVTRAGAGTATITVKAADGLWTAVCVVTAQ